MKSGKYVWLLIIAAAILTFGTVLAGCAPAGEEPIKIGLPFGKTGAHAVQGISEDNAARLFYEQKGLQVAGRPIKLIGGDTATNPAVALATTKRMVDFDQVHLIQGYISSAVGYGVSSYADESKTPMIGLFAGAGHSRDLFSPYVFRMAPSTFQQAAGETPALLKAGFKKASWIGSDYAAPREIYQAFEGYFEKGGGQIVQDQWPPLGATDYGPYLTAVKVDEADVLVISMFGSDSIRIMNQIAEFGLKDRIRIFGWSSFFDEGTTLPGMGLNAEGGIGCYVSAPPTDIPENKAFVTAYLDAYGQLPGQYAYISYIASTLIYAALEEIDGKAEDKEAFLKALETVKVKTPMGGEAFFDEKHGLIWDFIVYEVRKTNGETHIFEIDRVPGVKDPYDLFP